MLTGLEASHLTITPELDLTKIVKDATRMEKDLVKRTNKLRKQIEAQAWTIGIRLNKAQVDVAVNQVVAANQKATKNADSVWRKFHALERRRIKQTQKIRSNAFNQSTFPGKVLNTAQYGIAGAGLFALASGFRAVISESIAFDNAIFNNKAVLETTLETATLLAEAARQIGVEYGGALQEIDGAVLLLGRAGVATSKLADATRLVTQLATITGDTFEDTSKVVSSFVTVFSTIGVEALQADGSIKVVRKSVEELGNMLAYAANQSKLSTADLGTFSNHALTTAVTVGLTSEQVLALATSFSNLGVNASTIGTQIRKLDQVFNSSRGSIQIFWDALGDNFNQQEFAKRIRAGGKDSEIALQQFYDRVADMPKDVLAAATAGMPILTSNLIKLISKSAELIRRHSEGLRQGGVDVAQQAAINALGASKLFERAANSIVKSSDGMATSLLDAFTGRQELIEYREELDRLLVGTAMYEEKTRELKERMDSLQEGFNTLSRGSRGLLEAVIGIGAAFVVVKTATTSAAAAMAIFSLHPAVRAILLAAAALKAIDTFAFSEDREAENKRAAEQNTFIGNQAAKVKALTPLKKAQFDLLEAEERYAETRKKLAKAQTTLQKSISLGYKVQEGQTRRLITNLRKDLGVYKKEAESVTKVITQLQKANKDQTGFNNIAFSAAQEAQSKAFVERRRIAELFDKSDLVFQQRKLKLLQESLKEEKSRTLTAAIKLSIEKKEAIVAEQINKVRSLALRGSDDQTALGNAKLKLSIAKAANGVARTGVQIAQDTAALTEADIAMRIFEKTLDRDSLAHIVLMTQLEKERFAITVAQNKEKRDAAVQLANEAREAAAIRAQEVKIAVLEAFNPEDKRSAGNTDRLNEAIALQEKSLELAIASDIVKGHEKAINTENIKLLVLKNKKLSAEFDLINEIADAQEEAASAAMDATIANIELFEQSIDTFSAALDAANGNNWAKTLSKNIGRVSKTFTVFSKNRLSLEDKTGRQEKIYNDARKAAQTDITLLRAADSQNKSATNRIESDELGNQLSLYSGLAASAGAFFEEGTTGAKVMQTAQLALGTTMAFVAIAAASTLPLVGLAQGVAMAAALSSFAGIWLGSSPGGGSVQQVNPNVQAREDLGAEESLVIGRLDRQIELLESIDFTGSASVLRLSQAEKQFNFDIKSLSLQDNAFGNGFESRNSLFQGVVDAGEDTLTFGGIVTLETALEELDKGVLERLADQIRLYTDLLDSSAFDGTPFNITEDKVTGRLEDLQVSVGAAEEAIVGFSLTMIDVVGVMTDTGDTFKDLLDGLTGTSEFADNRLASAVTDVNGLLRGNGPTGARGPNGETASISQVALEKFLRGQVIAIDKVQLAFNKSVQEVLLSEESSFLEKEEAVRALNVATGKAFTVDNVQAAIDYVDSIELVAEAMANSNENTKSFEDSLKTSAQLQADQAAALNTTIPQTRKELLEMVEGFKEAENGIKLFSDAEREFAGQQLERLNEIRETSDANIQSFGDSLKTSDDLLQIMADTLGVDVVNSTGELTELFVKMQGGVDGLTNKELEFLSANEDMIKSLEEAARKTKELSDKNIRSFEDSLLNPEQKLQRLADTLGEEVTDSADELYTTFLRLKGGIDGLNATELDFLIKNQSRNTQTEKDTKEAAKTLESARDRAIAFNRGTQDAELRLLQQGAQDRLRVQEEANNDSLQSTRESISTLQGALTSLDGVSRKLRGQDVGAEAFTGFQENLNRALELSSTKDFEGFSEALGAAISGAATLDNSRAFTSEQDQKVAQLRAANTFDLIEDNSVTQIDLLMLIEQNTAGALVALALQITNSDAAIREDFLGDRDRQDALDAFNDASAAYLALNTSGIKVDLTPEEYFELRKPFAEQLETLAENFINLGGSGSTLSGLFNPIRNTIEEILRETDNIAIQRDQQTRAIQQGALDAFNTASAAYLTLNTSGVKVGLTPEEYFELRRPFAEQLEILAQNFINAGGSADTASGLLNPIRDTIGEILNETGNIAIQRDLQINGFANGGVSSGAQLALVSEGAYKNEAHVPLPDGKAIPVNLGNDGLKETIMMLAEEVRELQAINAITAKHMRRLDQRDELKERG